LTELLREVERKDARLAADLAREYKGLSERRAYGLNFERHVPETVDLPGRPIRRGDKVRFLPKRGASAGSVDEGIWRVAAIVGTDQGRVASLIRQVSSDGQPETATRSIDDLVVVAEFRDPIYPGFASTGRVERGDDKPFHTVINAENFHALQAASPRHIFAMKALAARTRDIDDLRLLAGIVGVESADAALQICANFYPDEPVSPRSAAVLRELFG